MGTKLAILGNFFIVLGICLGIVYKTPDILVNTDNIAIKESDNFLYSLARKNRNFVIKTWVKQNGQDKILSHTKYSNTNKRLKCDEHDCMYNKENNKSVLLAYKKENILKNCDNVDLIIQLSRFDYTACGSQIIKYADLEMYGTHSIWLTNSGIRVKRTRSNRPWHN